MVFFLLDFKNFAFILGTYFNLSTASRTFFLVSSLTTSTLLSTLETVDIATPDSLATSLIVIIYFLHSNYILPALFLRVILFLLSD